MTKTEYRDIRADIGILSSSDLQKKWGVAKLNEFFKEMSDPIKQKRRSGTIRALAKETAKQKKEIFRLEKEVDRTKNQHTHSTTPAIDASKA